LEDTVKIGTFKKQPRERISVLVNYEEALDPDDTLARVFPAEVRLDAPFSTGLCTLGATPLLMSETSSRVWILGGDDGARYKVTLRVKTRRGELLEDELRVRVKEI
jgi:hypothetical protein